MTQPAIQQGVWTDIDSTHRLVRLGECILDWVPADGSYRLWKFDYKQGNPLCEVVQEGQLPGFDASTTLTCIEPPMPVDEVVAKVPGTLDYMRSNIKHVVYIMLENRSFDHVCGWLYGDKDQPARVIGPQGPFKGASTEFYNLNGDQKVFLSRFRDGESTTRASSWRSSMKIRITTTRT